MKYARTAFALAALTWSSGARVEHVAPNDNRVAAGTLRDGVLTLRLEVREGLWLPDGKDGPGLVMQTFAEVGRALQNPGPLIRVPSGTTVRVSVHSTLRDSTVVLYGLHQHPGSQDDTIQVKPGATRSVSFVAGEPGTYFYWGATGHEAVGDRSGNDSQLHGAFIVDSAGRPPPKDRVFVLGSWSGPKDSAGNTAELRTINGVSWPLTERFTYTVGDTVRWRWVNPTDGPHPMHLHGFYFDITSRGSWAAETAFAREERPHVVTEMPLGGGTFAMNWVPDEPGNWMFHCHVAFHTSLYLSAKIVDDPADPIMLDPMHDMQHPMHGMVLGVTVKPGKSTARRPSTVTGARNIRLIAQAAPKRWHKALDEMAFVRQDGDTPPAADSVPVPSSPLVLLRGEPVRITVVNHTRAPTGVHWHGIEVPSYSDGVPNFSGSAGHVSPMIAPGDSFVALFTPLRSGTFMYHAHSNETFQVNLGLYGSLLVVDSASYHPERERLILLGGDGPSGKHMRINGQTDADTMHLVVGRTYRFRVIDLIADWTIRIGLQREDSVVHWKAVAKDGAELPLKAQVVSRASLITGPGQTMDFEYTPTTPGNMRFDVQQRIGEWKTSLPIRVDP